jgi:hypothetical protein
MGFGEEEGRVWRGGGRELDDLGEEAERARVVILRIVKPEMARYPAASTACSTSHL